MQRQNYFKSSSLARLAGDVDVAAVVFDDPVRRRKAEAGSALTFGRIERFKDARDDFRSHAGARVRNPETRRLAVDARANFNSAAAWHCIDRIEDQIEHHFAQLSRVTESVHRSRRSNAHIDRTGAVGGVGLPLRTRDLNAGGYQFTQIDGQAITPGIAPGNSISDAGRPYFSLSVAF